ncbi:MAG: glutamate--tRNA ligase, partial [Synechococcales cyanobacterium RM1_1_8]|nr:glutamate--tRNA ligase [Synechococcales cyanobacterium RM1_1_8]
WDEEPVYQSRRAELYQPKIQQLLDRGLAYRAYETPEELDAMRTAQKAAKQAPRYNNQHRNLTPEQEAAYQAEGRQAVIRFKIEDDRTIAWPDLVRGTVTWQGSDLGGDMVIARAAAPSDIGPPLYNFVVVVDDIDMAMTHIIRGEDHIGNTPKQILLYEALGAAVPEFGHTPLILNSEGRKLSKRDGVTSISDFQAMGYEADALVNYMTLLGWSPPEPMTERFSLAEAAQAFSFERVNKAGAKFDWDKLNWLNSQVLHAMPQAALLEKLMPIWLEAGLELPPEASAQRAWLLELVALIQPSLVKLNDAVAESELFFSATVPFDDKATELLQQESGAAIAQAFLSALPRAVNVNAELNAEAANDSAPDSVLTPETAQALISDVTQNLGIKKGIVMRTLRACLTGSLQGPDLMQAWMLFHQRGWDRQRLEQALAIAQSA